MEFDEKLVIFGVGEDFYFFEFDGQISCSPHVP
jgi:hypothetical protein